MLASHYLFETSLKKVVDDVKEILQHEVLRHPDYFADMAILDIFEHFPRESPQYCTVVSTLADLAGYAVTDILQYLTRVCATVYSGKNCSVFEGLGKIQLPAFSGVKTVHGTIFRFLEWMFVTDIICTILTVHGVPDNANFLIKCGLYMCSSQPSNPAVTQMILEQWSVIFSLISMKNPEAVFEQSTQFIINKAELFFVIMRFVRLDSPGCPADDLLEIMQMHMHRARQRKTLSSSMLTSMSTFLMTYPGEDTGKLKPFFDLALTYCTKDPIAMPGAVDIVVNLMGKMKWTEEEKNKFYFETVFPMAEHQTGITTAAKALRNLMCGDSLSIDWLYWVWGPTPRENELDFLKWTGNGDYISIFMKYFVNSKHYNVCPRVMKEIVVQLASIDFDRFLREMFPRFVSEIEKNTARFMCFLSIVPMINDPKFSKIAKSDGAPVSREMILEFNHKLGHIAASKLSLELSSIRDFELRQDQLEVYLQDNGYATDEIGRILENWEIESGVPVEVGVAGVSRPVSSHSSQYLTLVRIVPFILNSELFANPHEMEHVVKLAASFDYSRAKVAYQILQRNLKKPEYQRTMIDKLVKMVHVRQEKGIALVCLQLLVDVVDEMEPRKPSSEDELEYDIEFAAFIALTSEQYLIRIVGFDLLQKTNKVLKHGGLYSYLEANRAVESNVKNNMLLQQFPKRPGHHKFSDDTIRLRSALCSSYHSPWLYFLAEFCRVILSSNYLPLLKRIKGVAANFVFPKRVGHFTQGMFVVFLSTCYEKEYLDDTNEVYVSSSPFSHEHMESFVPTLKEIISKSKTKPAFRGILTTAIKHIHYSLVPMMVDCYPYKDNLQDVLCAFFNMMKAIDGNQNLKQKVYFPVLFRIVAPGCDMFAKQELAYTQEIFQRQKKTATNQLKCALLQANERLILWFLSSIVIWLDIDDIQESQHQVSLRSTLMLYVLNWASIRCSNPANDCNRIKAYAAAALVPIFESGPCFAPDQTRAETCSDILLACARCELRGFPIMKPLLMNNKQLLEHFLTLCFTKQSILSDVFFEAVYASLPDMENRLESDAARSDDQLFSSMAGDLFLLGLFKLKTGSLQAQSFLTKFMLFYSDHIQYKHKDELLADIQTKDIAEIPSKRFVRVSEFVVASALKRMLLPKFKGTTTVMSEIMMPWVKHFRMLVSEELCMPNVNSTAPRLTTKAFLEKLMEVTKKRIHEHDFDKLADLWNLLLDVEDHHDIVLGFITDASTHQERPMGKDVPESVRVEDMNEVKRVLFMCLLEKRPELTLKRIAQRCGFPFYAYITYEVEGDFDQELWMIPVLIRALKRHKDAVEPHLAEIVQFALLFHANQTQTLLKRLCKCLSVPYSRRTLGTGSLQRIVRQFQISIRKLENGAQFVDSWAREAMRWTIGSRVLRIAHTSLIIVNNLDYEIKDDEVNDLMRGICKSVGFFLRQVGSSFNITYEFINETFLLFQRHFIGHEQMCLDYMNAFMDFIVAVDAYFSNMLPLYSLCMDSNVTKDQASSLMLSALRPSFNELETDSKARETFDDFVKRYPWSDLQFVKAVLMRTNERPITDDVALVADCPLDVLNRVLSHYSLMIGTASADLKKRIFTISTLIVQRFTDNRQSKTQSLVTHDVTENSAAPAEWSEREVDHVELDKQSLVVIMRAAISSMPGTKEALDLIMAISANDPLIPTIPESDEMNREEVFLGLVQRLSALGRHQKEVVTLTDCARLRTSSNLLEHGSKPQILPFTLQTKLMSDIKKKRKQTRTGLNVDKWMRIISSVGMELQRNMAERIRAKEPKIDTYQALQMPETLISDDRLKSNAKRELQVTITDDEFLQLGES